MDAFDLSRRALSFGPAAALYDRIRPSYPAEAAEWLLGSTRKTVVDVGAGTGIFSRVLAEAGHDVIAVEPDPAMRSLIGADITTLAGCAESIPLPDSSVDAVVAAQSYHWFNQERAHVEIARVLRDGGIFGPLWNVRDESVNWVAEISRIAESEAQGVLHATSTGFGDLFEPDEQITFRHAVSHTADSLVHLIQSRSYYLTASRERQGEVESELRELTKDLPSPFDLPYITLALKARRIPRLRQPAQRRLSNAG